MAVRIQIRRDTAANWTSSNPTLASGEIGIETNTGKFKIGDGSTAWTSLSYAAAQPSDVTTEAATRAAADTTLQTNINQKAPKSLTIAVSDESTALTTGTAKITFRMPYAMTVTAVRASLSTAQTSGNILTVDINDSGTTILSTKLTIDNTEKTSTTAVTPPVISDTALADDAEITIDIDQIGDGTAKGLKVTIIGT